MKKLLLISLSLMITFSYVIANSLEAPKNLKLENSTINSLEVSWDAVKDAEWYYVHYSKQSGISENWYESIIEELVEETSVNILDLDKDTTYYVAITSVFAIDSDYEESPYSNEWVFTTGETSDTNDFALQEASVLSSKKIELVFNNNLDNSSEAKREFKIVNKNDSLDELEVVENNLLEEGNKLELVLDREMMNSWEYNITVISLMDSKWNNIKSWIDGLNSFVTPDIFEKEVTQEEKAESETEWSELEAAWETPVTTEVTNMIEKNWTEETNLSWKEVSNEELNKNTQVAAKNSEKLPQTWPEHWVLLIIALILWFLSFRMKFKKS